MAHRAWLWVGGFVCCCSILAGYSGQAYATDDAGETGRLLMVLLDTGRLTIGANQTLINDKSKGVKGFTDEQFEKELQARFKLRTGIDLANLDRAAIPSLAKTLLPQLVQASKSVVDEAQFVINMEGVGYKGFIPAVFGTAAASRFRSHTNVYLRQTALAPRNSRNAPDEYETKMLAQLADPAYPRTEDQVLTEVVEDGKAVRLLMPLYYDKACLACHGEPKGERDISGYAKEGAKAGDLGGVISVKIDRP